MSSANRKEKQTLKALPEKVRNIVRSGIAISSVSECVEELVYNSIDAGARNVIVGVNLDQFNVRVEDDGVGLNEADLEAAGIRYSTSKCHCLNDLSNLKYYGFRGEALASIIDVSATVDIVTRPKDIVGIELKKKFENGLVSGFVEKHNTTVKNPGTTVIIARLLAKIPVRQKRMDRSIQLEEVKNSLERISLINPNINIELRNEKTGHRIFDYKSSVCYSEAFDQLFRSRVGFDVNFVEEHFRFKKLFFTISISRDYCKKKYYQFVFVNNRFIRRCRIHKWVGNCVLENSNCTPGGSKSDRYPVFILNIVCAFGEYDITVEPKKETIEFKDWDDVQNGIEGLISKYKAKYNLISSNSKPETVDKNLSTISSYDIKGALHSRFAARSSEKRSPDAYITSSLSDKGSFETHNDREKRELQPSNRKLTRTGSNSHVVNVREIRRKRKTPVSVKGTECKLITEIIKKPRLTLGAFQKFPEWKEEFDKKASSTITKPSVGYNKPDLNAIQNCSGNIYDQKNETQSFSLEHSMEEEELPRKMERFFQNQENKTERSMNTSATEPVNTSTSKMDVCQALKKQTTQAVSNTRVSSRNSSGNTSKPKINMTHLGYQSVISMSGEYMESFLGGRSRSSLHCLQNKGKAIFDKIVKYSSNSKKKNSFNTLTNLFNLEAPNNDNFQKPKPLSNLPELVSNDRVCDVNMHPTTKLPTSPIQLIDEGRESENSSVIPPLLNFLPLQKSYTSDWNDNMMDIGYNEPDTELFPSDWSVEVVIDIRNQEWLKTSDTLGKTLYINMKTGSSSYDMVNEFRSLRRVTAEEIKRSYPTKFNWLRKHFPKGLNTFWNGAQREVIKHGDPSKLKDSMIGNSLQKCMNKETKEEELLKWKDSELAAVSEYFKNDADTSFQSVSNLVTADIKCWKQLGGVTNSFRFVNEDMQNCRVISQFDKKFIVAILRNAIKDNEMIVMFDQHAVHERIRLEKFVAESYVNPKAAKKYLVNFEVMPPYPLHLSETEVRIMQSYEDLFEQIGIKFQPISSTSVKIKTAPKCFCEKSATESLASREEVLRTLIHNLVQEQIQHIIETKGTGLTALPKTIFNVLCSQACHGAIKFGDELDYDTCCQLIGDLKKCKTMFQCAHGRPSIYPMINLGNRKTELSWNKTLPCRTTSSTTNHRSLSRLDHEGCSSYFCNEGSIQSSGYFSGVGTSFDVTKAPAVAFQNLNSRSNNTINNIDNTKPLPDLFTGFRSISKKSDSEDEDSQYF